MVKTAVLWRLWTDRRRQYSQAVVLRDATAAPVWAISGSKIAIPNVLVTKASDGSLVVAVWNLVNPGSTGERKDREAAIQGRATRVPRSRSEYVDEEHGNTLGAWEKMGSPRYPTQAQTQELRDQARTVAPQNETLTDGTITLRLSVNGLAVLQVR